MSAPVLGADRAQRLQDTQGVCAWMVVSASANYVGLFEFEEHARRMLNAQEAPADAVLFPMVKFGAAIPKGHP